MDSLLKIKNLSVYYPGFSLENISLQCNSGEIIGLIGVNGAGKSTTIKSIMGIIHRNSGEIYWHGKKVLNKNLPAFREHIGYVGDNDCYYPNIKLKKILSFVSELYSNWDESIMEEYIEKFALDTNKRMKEFSTGMRVKINLLIAISHNADLYLLDEPTSGLDPVIRKELLEILYNFANKENKGVIISSHITSDLEKIANRVIYLVDGKIMLDKDIEILRKDFIKLEILNEKPCFNLKDCLMIGNQIITTNDIYKKRFEQEVNLKIVPITLEDILFYLRAS